ncbi:hypothetical protein OK074_6636 [Actinobacteria bacterium OK074]|nr:hypothetical protein OK074_6636 [Actinobacteria bacterium OK074]
MTCPLSRGRPSLSRRGASPKLRRLRENSGAIDVEPTAEDLEGITVAADQLDAPEERYPERMRRWTNR